MKRVAMLFFLLIMCSVNANKTEAEYLNESNVFFDVQKSIGKLELVGRNSGKEMFRTQITDSAFTTFTEVTSDNFHVRKLEDYLLFQYRSDDDKEILDLIVKQNGDVSFRETDQTYTGWNEYKTYGIRTSGTLENRGNQAFYFLVASANQIHNYGTINSYSIKFFQNYLFNSGVLLFGETPTKITDLSNVHATNNTAAPSFKLDTIENYGTLRSNGKLKINGGMNYIEHGTSDFDDLDTSNGDISIDSGKTMVIAGNITGQVGSLILGNKSLFSANRICFSELQNFIIGEGSSFYSPNPYSLNVSGNFLNSGELTSSADITLHLKNIPTTKQSGVVVTSGNLNYSYETKDKPRNSNRVPDITKDPISRAQLLRTSPDPNSPAFKQLQEDFYRRVQYNPVTTNSMTNEGFSPGQLLAKIIRKTIYTDHYLNTITYHYTITKNQYGSEISRVLTDITQTGYIWQRRTEKTKEFPATIPTDIAQLLNAKGEMIPSFKKHQDERTKLGKQIAMLQDNNKAQIDQMFLKALRKAMMNAGANDDDVQAILTDPYFNSLAHFDDLTATQQYKFTTEHPETIDTLEAIDDARYDAHDLTRWLDSPDQKFLTDISIPLSALAMFLPQTRVPMTAYKGARAAVAALPRVLAPYVGKAAVVIGAGAVAGYERITTFFNENFGKTSTGDSITNGWREKSAPAAKDPKYITTQAEAKSFAKNWLSKTKCSMGKNKWVDRNFIYQIDDAKHHGNMVQIEVFRKSGKKFHEKVLDCFGREIKSAITGRTYNGK